MSDITGREILNQYVEDGIPRWWYQGPVQMFDPLSGEVQELTGDDRLLYIAYRTVCAETSFVISNDYFLDPHVVPRQQPLHPIKALLQMGQNVVAEFELVRRAFWRHIRKINRLPETTDLTFMIMGREGRVFLTTTKFAATCPTWFVDGPDTDDDQD